MRTAIRHWSLGLASGLLLLGLAAPAHAAGKAWLGVTTQQITDELRDALDLKGSGVLVNSVINDGPADRAGIRKGDVITSFNDHEVGSPGDLADAVQDENVGSTATVKVIRRGSTQTLSVKLGTRPEGMDDETPTPGSRRDVRVYRNGKEVDPDEIDMPNLEHLEGLGAMPRMLFMNDRGRLGVRIQKLNPDLASYFGGTNGKGALVLEVVEDTPADKAGIKAGDVIVRLGNKDIEDPDDLVSALRDSEGKVTVTVVRKGARRTIDAELDTATRRDRTYRFDSRAPRAPQPPDMSSNDDLRRQIEELRQQLQDMKKQLEERNR
jgi:serine protease Do